MKDRRCCVWLRWACVAALGVPMACTQRVTDFTVMSTKNNELTNSHPRGLRVKGEDCVTIILFIPLGNPDLKEASDRAIENGGLTADALVDGVVRRTSEIAFGSLCYQVEGTAVASTLSVASASASAAPVQPPRSAAKKH